MKKKLLPISVLCLFGMLLVGCGGTKKSSSQVPGSSVEPETSSVVPSSSEVAPASSDSASSSVQPAATTGVSLDQTAANVLVDQTLQLVATVAPENADNKELVWSSEDEDIATVNQQGVVTAVAVGTTEIKVKVKNTSFEAKCVVSVIMTINSVTITNESAFDGFSVNDIESLSLSVNPVTNVHELLAAGVVKTSSSDPTVASVTGLSIVGLKAGKTTVKVEIFGKEASMELTVSAPLPGVPYRIKAALDEAYTNAKPNGQSGNKANIYGPNNPEDATKKAAFEFGPAKVLAVAPDYDSSSREYSDTGYIALVDDGTAPLYLLVGKEAEQPIPIVEGDYIKVTCRLTNYYGLFEGIARNSETSKRAPYIFYQDVEKVDAPETPITASIENAVAMTGAEYKAYYDNCKTQSSASTSTAYVEIKHVSISAKFDAARNLTDKGGYLLYEDATNEANNLGLQSLSLFELDDAPDGHISQLEVYLIGANTSKKKSNGFIMAQTHEEPTAVAIDQEANTVVVKGNTLQMTYTTTPAGSYSMTEEWTSSDPAVGTIDNTGLFTGLYDGDGERTTTIKVKVGKDAGAVEGTVVIKVLGEDIPATSAEMSDATLSLAEGQEKQLTVSHQPAIISEKAVWSSSAEAVATVDQKGNVKAIKEGTAVITAKYNDNVSATCTLTVKPLNALNNYVGASVDFTGKLIAKSGKDRNGGTNYILDDGTAGFWVYSKAEITCDLGDILNAKGTTKSYSGGMEIDATSLTKVTDKTVTPTSATPFVASEAESLEAAYRADETNAFSTKKVSLRTGVIGGEGYYLTWDYGTAKMETNYSTGDMQVGRVYDIEGYIFKMYKSGDDRFVVIVVTSATVVEIAPTGVAVEEETLTLTEGANQTLHATVAPAGTGATISWKSSDETKATVDATGKVTAVAAGTATITAFIDADGDGQPGENELKDTCALTVEEKQGGDQPLVLIEKFDFVSSLTGYKGYNADEMDAFIKGSSSLGETNTKYVSHDKTGAATNPLIGANGTWGGTDWSNYNCLKLGSTTKNCKIKLTFAAGTSISKVVLKAAGWNGKTCKLGVNGGEQVSITSAPSAASMTDETAFIEYTFELSSATNEIVLETTLAVMISEIEFFG